MVPPSGGDEIRQPSTNAAAAADDDVDDVQVATSPDQLIDRPPPSSSSALIPDRTERAATRHRRLRAGPSTSSIELSVVVRWSTDNSIDDVDGAA